MAWTRGDRAARIQGFLDLLERRLQCRGIETTRQACLTRSAGRRRSPAAEQRAEQRAEQSSKTPTALPRLPGRGGRGGRRAAGLTERMAERLEFGRYTRTGAKA